MADREIIEVADAAGWTAWLEQNHGRETGVWLKIAKKGAPTTTPTQPEAVETALCFGWIDGQGRPLDEHYWLQGFTPRRARSKWSQINVKRVEKLIAEGRMRPAGLAQVEAAKSDGRWDAAYSSQSRASVPADFQRALDENPAAKEFFESLGSTQRYSFLYRINDAKRPETRQRRIAEYVNTLAERRTLR